MPKGKYKAKVYADSIGISVKELYDRLISLGYFEYGKAPDPEEWLDQTACGYADWRHHV